MADPEYEQIRRSYKPAQIKWLFIAESPPPPAGTISTRHFYRLGIEEGDRLFANTIMALYPQTAGASQSQLAAAKDTWLKRFQSDGAYMIEALDQSLPHGTTTAVRRHTIQAQLPALITKIQQLAGPDTKIILIKSNPFNIASQPLKQAGFKVLNTALLDYPGYWREEPYRTKLTALMAANGWKS